MTVPELWFEADRTNNILAQNTEDYNVFFFSFSLSLFFFLPCLICFPLLLSCPV